MKKIDNLQDLNIYLPRVVDTNEPYAPGHRGCVGCGEVLAMRLVAKAMGRNSVVCAATGCMEIISSIFPTNNWRIPWIHTLFENAAAVASGVEAAYKIMARKGKIPSDDINVVAMGGDGGTFDIGLQALSGALERGHKFLYVCFDNEAYMNTGVQRSSATPFGASTSTSPAGKKGRGQHAWKKNMPAIAAAHNIPYVATACISYPFDLMEKVKKALSFNGPSYIQVFSACPTGWKCASEDSIKIGRLAVESGAYPIYEIENGQYKITVPIAELRPLKEYLEPQRRFRHLKEEDIRIIEERLHREYKELEAKSKDA